MDHRRRRLLECLEGHNYIGYNYIGHNYTGHNKIAMTVWTIGVGGY